MAHGGNTARTLAPEPAPAGRLDVHADGHHTEGGIRAHVARRRPVYLAILVSRLVVLAVGFGAELVMRLTDADPSTWRPFAHAETYPHYIDVVTRGYTLDNAYDYPLLPALMSGGQWLGVPAAATAMLISNLCFVAGVIGVAWLGERFVGRVAATRAAMYLALAPFAYWFSIASTESLLLVLLAASTLLALRGTSASWLAAGGVAALAALTRPPGALVGVILLGIAIAQLRERRMGARTVAAALAAGAMVPLAVAGFFAYLGRRTGDPLAAIHAQDQFDRHLSLAGPFRALRSGAQAASGGSIGQAIELLATAGAAALLVWFVATAAGSRWEVRGWTAFGALSLLLPLATGVLWQMPRFALLVPPVFWALGSITARRSRVHAALLVLLPVALAVKVTTSVIGVEG